MNNQINEKKKIHLKKWVKNFAKIEKSAEKLAEQIDYKNSERSVFLKASNAYKTHRISSGWPSSMFYHIYYELHLENDLWLMHQFWCLVAIAWWWCFGSFSSSQNANATEKCLYWHRKNFTSLRQQLIITIFQILLLSNNTIGNSEPLEKSS